MGVNYDFRSFFYNNIHSTSAAFSLGRFPWRHSILMPFITRVGIGGFSQDGWRQEYIAEAPYENQGFKIKQKKRGMKRTVRNVSY